MLGRGLKDSLLFTAIWSLVGEISYSFFKKMKEVLKFSLGTCGRFKNLSIFASTLEKEVW